MENIIQVFADDLPCFDRLTMTARGLRSVIVCAIASARAESRHAKT